MAATILLYAQLVNRAALILSQVRTGGRAKDLHILINKKRGIDLLRFLGKAVFNFLV
jgi:hypothetical protein